ncbi:hypothetical protein GCM10017744_018660 [Streptomyces antimycoticus]
MLDLDHHALAGAVALVGALGHDAVEPRPLVLLEPLPGHVEIVGAGGEVHGVRGVAQRLGQCLAALAERDFHE